MAATNMSSDQRPRRQRLPAMSAVMRETQATTSAGQSSQAGTLRNAPKNGICGKAVCGVHNGQVAAISASPPAATARLRRDAARSTWLGSPSNVRRNRIPTGSPWLSVLSNMVGRSLLSLACPTVRLSQNRARSFRSFVVDEKKQRQGQQRRHDDCRRDLPRTIGPLAVDLPGARIDQDLEGSLSVTINHQPNRKQQMFERDGSVRSLDVLDNLFVAADFRAGLALDRRVDVLARLIKTVLQLDVVRAGQKAGQHVLREGQAPLERPGAEAVHEVATNAAGCGDQDVVEHEAKVAGRGPPARFHFLPAFVAAADRFPIVLASLAAVVGLGDGVERPERQVDAVELARFGPLGKLIRREPAGADPADKVVGGSLANDLERQNTVDRNSPASGVDMLALHGGAAIGALETGQRADEYNGRPAAFAANMVLQLFVLLGLIARLALLLE